MAFGPLTGIGGIQPGFLSSLEALRRALPNNLGSQIGIRSGYRSPQHQADLFRRAVQRYGSVAAARKWVAPPGRSQHNKGNAIDLSFGSPEAMRAAHAMAGQFGLVFPMSYENWHIEPIGARGGGPPATTAAAGGPGPEPPSAGPGLANLFTNAVGGDTGGSGASEMGLGGGGGGGGSGSGGGITGDPSPIPIPDLRTAAAPVAAAQPAKPASPPGLDQLASLFTLPAIGTSDEIAPDEFNTPLPGQAKPLTRKVWK